MCPFVDRQSNLTLHDLQLKSEKERWMENRTRIQSLADSIPDLSNVDVAQKLSKNAKLYYRSQSELLNIILDLEKKSKPGNDGRDDDDSHDNSYDDEKRNGCHASPQFMAKITFAINLMLLIAKVVASVTSGSLSVISSALDSAVDLISGALLWISTRAIEHTDIAIYPRGRGRLEPVSIVVLAVIMSMCSFQITVTSIERMITYVNYDLRCTLKNYSDPDEYFCDTLGNLTSIFSPCMDGATGPSMKLPTIIICILTIVIKLVMFLVYRRFSNSSIQALAQDHRNDVLSNSVAVTFGYLGYRFFKYIDPIGALVIAGYIIVNWSITAIEQVRVITGITAGRDQLNNLIWFILGHDPNIRYIDDLRAFYHSSEGFVVEVDIILPSDMGLKESHDIGESLGLRLEKLPRVDKAYVHTDYSCNNYKIWHITHV